MSASSLRRPLALALSLIMGLVMSLGAVSAAQAVPGTPTISGLTTSASLDQPFSPAAYDYTATVSSAVSTFTVTPTVLPDSGYTLSVYNNNAELPAVSGESITGSLRGGPTETSNFFRVIVSDPQAGTSQAYTIWVTRLAPPPPPPPAYLSELTLIGGTLNPSFLRETPSYSVNVPYTTTSVTFDAIAEDAGADIIVLNAGTGATGTVVAVPLVGAMVLITVTAPGKTDQVYSVHITRDPAPTADVDLDALYLSIGDLEFDPATTSYTAHVPYAVRSLAITASPSVPENSMFINNEPMSDGVPVTVTVNYNGGSGYAIRVVAPNGAEKSYSVQILRDPPSSNADLTALSLSEGTLSPSFANLETAYTATVPYLTTSITVTPTVADATAIARVNGHDTVSGSASQAVPLHVGANAVTVEVTAEDGVTTTTRTVTVTREAPELRLADLTVSAGTLSPVVDADTDAYTVTVPYLVSSLDVTAAAIESAWDLTIDGAPGGSASIPLAVGTRTVTITVTALYGESRDYTIAVTREAAPAPQLTFTQGLSAGQLADGAPVEVSGADLLPGSTATLTMYSTPVVLTTAIVPGSASVTLSAQLPAGVPAGAHRVVFDGFAQDGTPVSTTMWFTVLRDGTVGAVSLTGPVAYDEAALAATGADTASGTASALLLVLLGVGLALLGRAAQRRARRA